jgi:hypothetical protein
MSWRQVAVLYLIVIALAVEYWFVERPRRPPPATADGRVRPRWLDLAADALQEVRLDRAGRTVLLRRGESGWAVIEPRGVAVPPDLLAAFANALAAAEEIERVAESAEGDAFGLGAEAVQVQIRAGGQSTMQVTLGGTNPTGTAIYARRADRPTVVLIGRNVRYYEDLIFRALPQGEVPVGEQSAPVGG